MQARLCGDATMPSNNLLVVPRNLGSNAPGTLILWRLNEATYSPEGLPPAETLCIRFASDRTPFFGRQEAMLAHIFEDQAMTAVPVDKSRQASEGARHLPAAKVSAGL